MPKGQPSRRPLVTLQRRRKRPKTRVRRAVQGHLRIRTRYKKGSPHRAPGGPSDPVWLNIGSVRTMAVGTGKARPSERGIPKRAYRDVSTVCLALPVPTAICDAPVYLFAKLGGRFSMNAAMPSF